MSRRNQLSAEKKARKQRNRDRREQLLLPTGEGRLRWQGSAPFQFGKDPRTRLDLVWSGVKVPVDVADPNHIDGLVELTDLALTDGGEVGKVN